MDFQLILYIIIVIVWLVLDNYRRIKKKQEQTGKKYSTAPPKKEVPKPYTTLEDILREFGMEEEPDVLVEKSKPQPSGKPARKKTAAAKQPTLENLENYESSVNYESYINKDYKFSSETLNKGYQPLVIEAGDIKKSEIKGLPETGGRKAKMDFDLRKAVIWSEILKRPYA